jgi:hypothetical protein
MTAGGLGADLSSTLGRLSCDFYFFQRGAARVREVMVSESLLDAHRRGTQRSIDCLPGHLGIMSLDCLNQGFLEDQETGGFRRIDRSLSASFT